MTKSDRIQWKRASKGPSWVHDIPHYGVEQRIPSKKCRLTGGGLWTPATATWGGPVLPGTPWGCRRGNGEQGLTQPLSVLLQITFTLSPQSLSAFSHPPWTLVSPPPSMDNTGGKYEWAALGKARTGGNIFHFLEADNFVLYFFC